MIQGQFCSSSRDKEQAFDSVLQLILQGGFLEYSNVGGLLRRDGDLVKFIYGLLQGGFLPENGKGIQYEESGESKVGV